MKDDSLYPKHIADCIRLIGDFTREGEASFLQSELIQSAVIRQFEIIGEASKQLSETFRTANPEIPWHKIAGMRDRLIHGYFGVNLNRVWQTVCEDLPPLHIVVTNALTKQL